MTRKCTKLRFDPTQPASRRAPAFTLIELIIVIGIIGVVLSIAVPTIGRVFTAGADAQAHNIMSAQLTVARAQAMRRGSYVGVHVQMADPVANLDLADACFVATLVYDYRQKKFNPDPDVLPQRIPGNMAFGELTSDFVDANGNYKSMDDTALGDFTTFTVVFSSAGALVRQVNGQKVKLDSTDDTLYAKGGQSKGVWSTNLVEEELATTAMAIFDYSKLARTDADGDGDVDGSDRAKYLDLNGQFLTINVYTGQLDRRQ